MDFIRLLWSGETQCDPLYKCGPMVRERYILHYVVSGKGFVEFRGRCEEVTAGRIFVIYKGERISYRADQEYPWRYIWADFDGTAAEELLQETGFSAQRRVSPLLDAEKIYPLFCGLEGKLYGTPQEIQGASELVRLIAEIAREFPAEKVYECGAAQRAASLIRAGCFDSGSRIEEIAAMVGVSRSQLYRLFKKEFEISPKRYLDDLRVARAEQLLEEGIMSISEVAYACGFNDPLYFSAEFKKRKGAAPREFRQKIHGE